MSLKEKGEPGMGMKFLINKWEDRWSYYYSVLADLSLEKSELEK